MSTVSLARPAFNLTATPAGPVAPNTSPATPAADSLAFAWKILAAAAEKEFIRDDLAAGSIATANLLVSGDVNGQPIRPLAVSGLATVGHDGERAASQTPNASGLIAYLLGKLNEQTRAAVLRDLPAQFEAAGCEYPAADKSVAEASELMLKKLRAAKRGPVRGSVSVKATVGFAKPAASVGG